MKKTTRQSGKKTSSPLPPDFFKHVWDVSWTYIKTVVDVVREPVLVLNPSFNVVAANDAFYKTFHADSEHTLGKNVYELGNGQWDIPELRKLLEDILPKHTFFNGFQVVHHFPTIGKRVILLNGRQLHFRDVQAGSKDLFPPIILLAMEDVTEMMTVAEQLAEHTNQFQEKLTERTRRMESQIERLKDEIADLKKRNR